MVTMGQRAVSVSPQTAAGTAAVTYHWMPKETECTFEVVTEYDTPDLLAYLRVRQWEADPTFAFTRVKGKGFVDEYAALPLCGLAGQPTSLVWLVGAIDPDLLTITKVNGLPTCEQTIDALCTLWQVTVDATTGRNMVEWEAIGIPVTPFTAPTPTIPTSSIQRAGQSVGKLNTVATKLINFQAKFTQPADPLYTTPLATGTEVFVLPDEMESPGVYGSVSIMYKLLAYAASSLENARKALTEAWLMTMTRGSFVLTITIPKVQPSNPTQDDSKPRTRQTSQGPILGDTGIGALASIGFAGSAVSYAKS